jgi:DNA polymerase-3 subunit delta'
MLPTILSRCQRLRFDPLPPEAIAQALVAREGIEEGRAGFVARMADGSYTQALTLTASDELAARRQLALDFVRQAYTQDPMTLPVLIEQIGKLGREPIKQLLGLMLGWVRDLVLFQVAGERAPLVNVDQAEAVRRFVSGLPDARLEAMAGLVEDAADLVERNVSPVLVLTVLAQVLSAAMRGDGRTRLFRPLAEPLAA